MVKMTTPDNSMDTTPDNGGMPTSKALVYKVNAKMRFVSSLKIHANLRTSFYYPKKVVHLDLCDIHPTRELGHI